MGDGLLAEFISVTDAVNAAIEIQEGAADFEAERAANDRIALRMGVNLGDVIHEGGEVYGNGVNVAARLEALADSCGLCISGQAFDMLDSALSTRFKDIGTPKLKNIAKPVQVYQLTRTAVAPPDPAPKTDAFDLPDKPSIAVLAFVNMSGAPEEDYFCDGIAEDILTELSRFRTLFVIARNSSFAYKRHSVDVKQIGRELGVRYVLEGSVRRAGGRVRVTGQLIDSETGAHVWAERYDRDLEDIFKVQEEITCNVVASTTAQIDLAEMRRVGKGQGPSYSSYDLGLKAQAIFHNATRKGDADLYRRAQETADSAIAIDPSNATALFIRAWTTVEGYLYRWDADPDQALCAASDAAEKLMETDASDPRAYTARGFVHHFRGNFEAAIADLRYAHSLNPNFTQNLFIMAWSESLGGYPSDAKAHAQLGLRLSPRDTEIWTGVAYLALAQASFAEADIAEAERWARLSIQMHSSAPIRNALLIACLAARGELEDARKQLAFLNGFAPGFVPSLISGELSLYRDAANNGRLITALEQVAGSFE